MKNRKKVVKNKCCGLNFYNSQTFLRKNSYPEYFFGNIFISCNSAPRYILGTSAYHGLWTMDYGLLTMDY